MNASNEELKKQSLEALGYGTPNEEVSNYKIKTNVARNRKLGIYRPLKEEDVPTVYDFLKNYQHQFSNLDNQEDLTHIIKQGYSYGISLIKNITSDEIDKNFDIIDAVIIGCKPDEDFFEFEKGNTIIIDNIVVKDMFRSDGIGSFLVHEFISIFKKDLNIENIICTVSPYNTNSLMLFLKQDFKTNKRFIYRVPFLGGTKTDNNVYKDVLSYEGESDIPIGAYRLILSHKVKHSLIAKYEVFISEENKPNDSFKLGTVYSDNLGVILSDNIKPDTTYIENPVESFNHIENPAEPFSIDKIYKEKIDDNSKTVVDLSFSCDNVKDKTEMGPSNPFIQDGSVGTKGVGPCPSGHSEKDELNKHKELKKIKSLLTFNVNEDRPQDNIDKNKKDPVLQDWVMNLNWKMQTGLISAIRGYDNDLEDDNHDIKSVIKMIRFLVLRNADNSTSFMSKNCLSEDVLVDILFNHIDKCVKENKSIHWVKHLHMAIDIIMNYHHSSYVKYYWIKVAKMLNEKIGVI